MISLNDLISTREGGDYQREAFDSFLEKTHFSFNVPAIHIAGTNGKGSTATYIAKIYEKAGFKVGLYTSPALININEMIVINGEEISDEQIGKYIKENEKLYKKYDVSSFEIWTHIALTYFQDCHCDIAIIECGMGGEIDATNIFIPVLSIITSVTLEHTSFLGRSVSEIARMKAGIIKDEIPVLVGDLEPDALDVISLIANEKKSKLHQISLPGQVTYSNGYDFNYGLFLNMHINSLALYSVDDAVFALDAISILNSEFPVSIEQARVGLNSVNMPARLEVVRSHPFVIVDGAHNPEAMDKLAKSIENPANGRKIHTIFACFRDKNLNSLLSEIGEVSSEIILTTFDHPRARNIDDYFLFAEDYSFIENPVAAINEAMEKYPDDVILITGSLAFAGLVRNMFKNGVFGNE